MTDVIELIDKLNRNHSLETPEYERVISENTEENRKYAASLADKWRRQIYGKHVFTRGLIEFTNICKNDCYYCGIRKSNDKCERYRLSKEEILECCKSGYNLGFRTFVLQGGEDLYFTDERLADIISSIKADFSDVAVTLSLGERQYDSYKLLYEAGADRYLLRHETADKTHYEKLHPESMSFDNRMRCLEDLKTIGYQVGCGFMVGSPYQSVKELAKDLKFIETFSPDMCGIGPFIPHQDTPFGKENGGTADMTLYLLSIIRIMKPNILLPATTALGTIDEFGREKGLLAGANVLMPNLSPVNVRKKYELYDNKICTGDEAAECRKCLEKRVEAIGFELTVDRGDIIK